ncbi:septum site-determining protein MinC [Gloeobacter kilaueensis]|uniref:Probable septum site-determining protein MinC n=1 Tax=Gloeobacter kilaueensis (strain ATCC BAA-2537 / CCAP 1431/1 / ULC 316 / JS1) TaxID=1183438 RepID=U5QRL9_GLOK1|nr:septum formation inhibitor [Gloeobacter kilaueensis JS1]
MQTLPNSLPAQVTFKGSPEGLRLILPVELPWDEIVLQLQHRLNAGERLWQGGASVVLEVGDRLLDGQQLTALDEALAGQQLHLMRVRTGRRQTAVAAAVAGFSVDQPEKKAPQEGEKSPEVVQVEPLYVQTTLRSGMCLAHPGTIVVVGDVNPGAELIADGDILVWGTLRGMAHAGARGNTRALIFALRLRPTQLRIAERVARAPDEVPAQPQPEVAFIQDNTIHIAVTTEFARRRN